MKHIITLTISLLLLFLFACQPGGPAETGPSPTLDPSPTADDSALDENLIPGTKSLQQALSEAGADVALEGSIDQAFFSAPGQIISVNGEPVQVFEYIDPADFPDLDGIPLETIWGPDVDVAANLFSPGWGQDGQTEAIISIARCEHHGNDVYYWYGVLLGRFE
jgi:hypothetical protein